MYWIPLPESWKAGSDSSGRRLFPTSGVYEQQPRLSEKCQVSGLSRNHCLLGHVGSVPPLPGPLCGCECQVCVLQGTRLQQQSRVSVHQPVQDCQCTSTGDLLNQGPGNGTREPEWSTRQLQLSGYGHSVPGGTALHVRKDLPISVTCFLPTWLPEESSQHRWGSL